MKKLIFLVLALILALSLCCCALAEGKKDVTVAIAKFAVHGSLDNCREGFLKGLAAGGYVEGENLTVKYENAQADMSLAANIAANFTNNDYDLICAIATPMAVCAFNAAEDRVPVVYTAVSAPVEAGLAREDGLGEGNVTGSSDLLPVSFQLEAIRALLPEAKTIGILYTIGETNSQVQLKQYQEAAAEYGFKIVEKGVSTGADIALALPVLLPQVDCLSMLTDNTVVQYLDVVLDESAEAGKPVFGSEVEQVTLGCVAAVGLDYVQLGYDTGLLAARVLDGENAQEIPYLKISESAVFYNSEACAEMNIEIPASILEKGQDMSKAE